MITPNRFLDALKGKPEDPRRSQTNFDGTPRLFRLAVVDPAWDGSGWPKVTFEEEDALTTKEYPYAGAPPIAGDRVVLARIGGTDLIMGAIAPSDSTGSVVFEDLTVNDTLTVGGVTETGNVVRATRAAGALFAGRDTGNTVDKMIITSSDIRWGDGTNAVDVRHGRTAPGLVAMNSGALFGGAFIKKPSDQTVTNSSTLVNDTALASSVAADAVYIFDLGIFYTDSGAGDASAADIKFGFSFPGGASLNFALSGPNSSLPSMQGFGDGEYTGRLSATSGSTTLPCGLRNDGGILFARISGIITTSATSGTLTFMFAENAAVASTSAIVKAASWMLLQRVS